MGKSKRIFLYTGVLLLLVMGVFVFFQWNKSTVLSEVHDEVKQTGMIASSGGFKLDEKDEVEISVKSSIYEGSALITLQSESGAILYTFDTDCLQKETFSLDAGSYIYRVDSDEFRGKFDIVVRK